MRSTGADVAGGLNVNSNSEPRQGTTVEAEARPRQQKISLEAASSRGICLEDYISDINIHPHQRHQVCSTVGSKDFKFKSYKLWNILLKETKLIESISQFQCKV